MLWINQKRNLEIKISSILMALIAFVMPLWGFEPSIALEVKERKALIREERNYPAEEDFEAAIHIDRSDASGVGQGLEDSHWWLMEPGSIIYDFSEVMGLRRLPYVGLYAHPYQIAHPLLILKLPINQLLVFPPEIQNEMLWCQEEAEIYLLIFDDCRIQNRHRNLFFHPWCFPSAGNVRGQFAVGVFHSTGILPNENGGFAFDTFADQDVHVHPAGGDVAMSPNNMRFTISGDSPVSSFFTAIIGPQSEERNKQKGLAAFCILIHTEAESEKASKFLKECRSFGALRDQLSGLLTDEHCRSIISTLLQYQSPS